MPTRGYHNKKDEDFGPSIYEDCGTTAAWNRHKAKGTETCKPCQAAVNNYMHERRHKLREVTRRSVYIDDRGISDEQALAGALVLEQRKGMDPFETVQKIIDAVFPDEATPIEQET